MNNPVLLIIIPLLLAFVSVIIKKAGKWILLLGVLINTVLAFFITTGETIIGGFLPPAGINLVVTQFTLVGVILINSLMLLTIIMSIDLVGKYSVILLTALAGINGMLLTGDLFNLFIFMEITVIAAYILSAQAKKYHHTITYLIIGSVGSTFYLLGIILLYHLTGSLNMADVAAKLPLLTTKELLVPILLIFIGIGVEVKLLPVSGWVKGVYAHANRLIAPLFASIIAGTALFVFGKLFVSVLPLSDTLTMLILVMSVMTFVFGEFAAFKQKQVKEILLFSSIGQAGLITALFISGLVYAAVILIISNVVSKLIMFTIAGAFTEKYQTDNYHSLSGVFVHNKITGIAFTIAALSMTGIPLLIGFYAKLNILIGFFHAGNYVLPVIVLLMTIVEGAYIIKLLLALWAPGKEGQVSLESFAVEKKQLLSVKNTAICLIVALVLIVGGTLIDTTSKIVTNGQPLLGDESPYFIISQSKGGE
ncbi:MAG: hypothetical protein KAG94_01240 [Clostridiales bacterium]|nr:hypothetical protein [Clostridiales bacterium]